MKNLSSLLLFLFLIQSVNAQENQRIDFDQETIILKPTSRGYEAIYRVNSDTIKFRGVGDLVKYPPNFNCKDTGYFFSYFTGCPEGVLGKVSLVIIENYKSNKARFWVDLNGNFDLSDDGPPTELSSEGDVILKFRNCSHPDGVFPVRFFREDWDCTTIENLRRNYGKAGPLKNGTFRAEIEYWFASQRKDIKVYKGNINGQVITLGLHDRNCDGLYTRNEKDKLLISKGHEQQLSDRVAHGAVPLKDTTYFFINEQAYELIEIDKTGSHIIIKPTEVDFKAPIIVGDKLKNYSFPFMDGHQDLMDSFKGKPYLLIDIWGSWCGGCVQQAPVLIDLLKNYPNQITILGLNSGDSPESKEKFETKFNIPWESGTLSDEIKNDLHIEGFPTYLLLDENLELIMYDSHPYYILEFLEENSNG